MNNHYFGMWVHSHHSPALIAAVLVFIALEIILTGFALWYSARNKQKAWFIVFMIVHTLGILEAVYLIWFRKDKNAARIAPPPATPPAAPPVSVPPSSSSAA